MSPLVELLAFAGVMALGQFSPGPDMLLLTRNSLKRGGKVGVVMALGIATGLAVHATIAVAGLALALERLPALRETMRWLAAGYLLWLAYRIAVAHFVVWYTGGSREERAEISTGNPYLQGLACNLLNPKAAIFLAAASAPFLRGAHPPWWPFAIWGIVVGQAAVLWSAWAWLLQWAPLRSRYQRIEKWIDLAFATALAGLSIRLMWG